MRITEKIKNALRRKKKPKIELKKPVFENKVAAHQTSRFQSFKTKLKRPQITKETFAPYKKYAWPLATLSIILLISVLVFRNFLFTNEWPGGGDVLGWISREYLYGNDSVWLHVWRPYSFGFVEIVNLLDFFLFAIHSVLLNGENTVKVFMFSSYVLAGVSVYAFAYHYTHKHVAALSASLVYLFNQWLISQLFEAHIEIVFSYAVAPLLFLALDKALETTKLKHILASAILLTVAVTAFHAECIVIYGVFLILFTIFYLIIPTKDDSFVKRSKRLLKVYAPLAIIVFLLSSFTLLPLFFNARPQYYSTSYAYSLDEADKYGYKNLLDAFTLKSTEAWGYLNVADYNALGFPGFPSIILAFIFALAYLCVLLIRRDRYTIFFAFSALFAVFMSMGPHPPFGEFFIWAWSNIPHFAVFRAISRWIMIAILANAFFVSLLVGLVVDYIERRIKTPVGKTFFKIEARSSKNSQSWVYSVSLDFVNKLVKGFHKIILNLSVLLLIFVFVSPALEGFYLIDEGLQVYTPPRNYLVPYVWVGSQSGDFRVVTVGQHPVDFADGAMTAALGWSHEIGVDSSFITGKPTLQDGGWETLPHSFVEYLRFRVVPYNMTDDLMKMLGVFNYRYVVIPSYANDKLRQFFVNQQNTHTVFNSSGVILENDFYNTRMIGTKDYVTVLGDLNSFTSLNKINSFNLNSTTLLFVDQMPPALSSNLWFTNSPAFITVDSNFTDLLMWSIREDSGVIKASRYGVNSFTSQTQWIQSSEWINYGKNLIGDKTLQTSGKNSINIPFKTQSDGIFIFSIRLGFALYRGVLSVSVDGVKVKDVKPITYGSSNLLWANLGILNLKGGNHEITLSNDGSGPNDIDALAVINLSDFEQQKTNLYSMLRNFSGRLVYLLDAENAFSYNSTSGWIYQLFPYNGFGLHLGEVGGNVALTGTASASSTFSTDFVPTYAIDDSTNTRWASATGESQWFKIEWPVSQELAGVQIAFEEAKAKDFMIQTWNGTSWINQITVTDNNQTQLYYRFQQPASTTKLQISMNATTDYNMVSIWEIKAFTTRSSTSAKIDIPRPGLYKLAFRLASGPDYGTVNIELANLTMSILCQNQTTGFNWYEAGPVFLENGEQSVSVNGVGKIDFDAMTLYSVGENETISLNNLFKTSDDLPIIDYERVDSGRYNVHIRTNSSFLLIFSDSYHPLWRAYVDGSELSPMIADYFVNCFFIDKTGEFNATLYFTGQTYTDIGLRISFGTFLVVVGLCIVPSSVFRRIRSRLTRKRRQYT